MKKTFITWGTVLFILILYSIVTRFHLVERALANQTIAANNKTSTNQHPTKEEWLEVYMSHCIKTLTDAWQQRIAVRIWIDTKHRMFVVALTSANGQEEISKSSKKAYIDEVEPLVKAILAQYDWAKDYKLNLQYI